MPFLNSIDTQWGVIGLWKMVESSDYFLENVPLNAEEKKIFSNITHERRKREFFAVRLIIKELTGYPIQPQYKKDGSPYLPGFSRMISISHSSDLAAIFLTDRNAGIDTEVMGRSLKRITSKFLSEKELIQIHQNFQDAELGMLLHWCAKEAVFKCTRHQAVGFRSQIYILPFNPDERKTFRAKLFSEGETETFSLQYRIIEDNLLVWCIENNIEIN